MPLGSHLQFTLITIIKDRTTKQLREYLQWCFYTHGSALQCKHTPTCTYKTRMRNTGKVSITNSHLAVKCSTKCEKTHSFELHCVTAEWYTSFRTTAYPVAFDKLLHNTGTYSLSKYSKSDFNSYILKKDYSLLPIQYSGLIWLESVLSLYCKKWYDQ